ADCFSDFFPGLAYKYKRFHLIPDKRSQQTEISVLVSPSCYEDNRFIKAFQRFDHSTDISSLGIVDEPDAVYFPHKFEPVFQSLEFRQCVLNCQGTAA